MRWFLVPAGPDTCWHSPQARSHPPALAPFDYWPLAILLDRPALSRLARPSWQVRPVARLVVRFQARSAPAPAGSTSVSMTTAPPRCRWRASSCSASPPASPSSSPCRPGCGARCLCRDNAPLGDALAFAALWLALELFRSWFLPVSPGSTPAIASCRDRWPGWCRWVAYGCPPSSSPSARPCW